MWPHSIELAGTTEELLDAVEQRLQDDNLVQRGEHVVVIGGMPIATAAHTNFVKLHQVGGS
jgi:pyruvate kinase